MKTFTVILAVLGASAPAWAQTVDPKKPWKPMDKGVRWEKSLEEAQRRASHEAKPVLLFQLVGDLTNEGC